MSSSPLVTDELHNFVSFGSNFHNVHFDEPAPAEHYKSDLLRQRITEVLGNFQDVSPRLLSDLNEDPDLLYGIDTPNTPVSPPSSRTSPFGSSTVNNSPKHLKKRHLSHNINNSEKKTGKMMGSNGRVISPGNGKGFPPKILLNSSSTKPADRTNPPQPQPQPQRKPQAHLGDMKSRPTASNKHKSRNHLPSPNLSNPNNSFIGKAESVSDPKNRSKKPMNSSNSFAINKKTDRPRERELTSAKNILQSDAFNLQRPIKSESQEATQRISPKEDPKPISAVSSYPFSLDKSKQPMKSLEEIRARKKQLPNLELALDRDNNAHDRDNNAHDDSINQLFNKGMEPLPTPLEDIVTPVINKKFGNFPNPKLSQPRVPIQEMEQQMLPPMPLLQSSPSSEERMAKQNSSDSADSSDSDTDLRDTGQVIGDIYLSSDTESSDSSPMNRPRYIQTGVEDVFPPSPPKKAGSIRTTHSSSSSDSSDEEQSPKLWTKAESNSTRSSHTPPSHIKTERFSTSSQRFSSPRDVKPDLHSIATNSNRRKTPSFRKHGMETDDSDDCSPGRKRFKVSIPLDRIALKTSFIVSFPRDKLSLTMDKPAESSKQMARVQPIQRHIPDPSKETLPPFSLPPQNIVRSVQPQVVAAQRISRKSPHNMMDYKSPDPPWQIEPGYDSSQIITSTPKPVPAPGPSRWPGNSEPRCIPRPTKVSTSHDYLTEAKRLKHQADRYKSNYDKALYYCEAALSFMLYGDQLEITSKLTATSTYSDTFELLDFVLRPSTGIEGGLGFSNECHPQLILICLRCQSIIFNRLFVLKQEGEKNSHSELRDFFSGYKSDTKAKTPVSNSPYHDSQWSPSSMVSVPQKIANINSDYLQVMEFSFRSMELWNKSQLFEEDSLPFIQRLNAKVEKCIDRFSSIKDTTAWCKVGLNWLKADAT